MDSDNQVLHGHSMQDGRMFWQVIGFGSAKTVKSCPVFRLTPKGSGGMEDCFGIQDEYIR